MGASNAVPAYSPHQAGTWSRHDVAAYGDVEMTGADDAWTLDAAVRFEDLEDFGTTTNGKLVRPDRHHESTDAERFAARLRLIHRCRAIQVREPGST